MSESYYKYLKEIIENILSLSDQKKTILLALLEYQYNGGKGLSPREINQLSDTVMSVTYSHLQRLMDKRLIYKSASRPLIVTLNIETLDETARLELVKKSLKRTINVWQ